MKFRPTSNAICGSCVTRSYQHTRGGTLPDSSCRLGGDEICNLMKVAPCKGGETENTVFGRESS